MASVPIERRTWMPAYVITIHVIMTILLGIRLLSRFRRFGGRLGLDDVFISLAWVISTGNAAATLLGCYKYGFDRHIWDVPPELWPKAVLISWVISMSYLFSTGFTKISVLLFYRRLVTGTCSRRFKFCLWAAMALIVCYTLAYVILLLVTCIPLQATWLKIDPTYTKSYRCASTGVMTKVSELSGAFSVITDFYSVLLPAILLLQIKITRRQKLGLMAIFGVGFLVVIAGIVRTYYLGQAQGNGFDKTWLAFNVFVAGIAEGNIAIICACAPSLKSCFGVFFRDRLTKLGLSSHGRTAGSNSGSKQSGHTRMMETPYSENSQLPVLVEKSWAVASSSSDMQDEHGISNLTSIRSEGMFQPTRAPSHSRLGAKDKAFWG